MAWWNFWRGRGSQPQNVAYSITDPNLLEYFGIGVPNYANVPVTETSTLGISAMYRAVCLVAGTIAGLPLTTMMTKPDGTSQRVASVFDNPGGAGPLNPGALTVFDWKETAIAHMMLHGDAFARHVYNQAGGIAALELIHPSCVSVQWDQSAPWRKEYWVTTREGNYLRLDDTQVTQFSNLSMDGLRGLSIIGMARNGLGTAIAADRAAAKLFSTGAMHAGVMVPEEDTTLEEAKAAKQQIDNKMLGWENSGSIPVVNRKWKFVPWTMSLADAQFLESRKFQIEDIARLTGVPPHLLMQTDKQTSWGAGVAEQNRGLARFTLSNWTGRMEARGSVLLPRPRELKFDFAALERPVPEVAVKLVIDQVSAGIITVNEGRKELGRDPVPGGDELKKPAAPPQIEPAPEPEPEKVGAE